MRKLFAGLGCVLSLLLLANGQQRTARSEVLRTVSFNNIDMAAILAALAADYDGAIGLETDPDKPKSQITLFLRGVTFSRILDGVVQAEPRYRWRDNNGSIDVLPISGGIDFLDHRIDRLQLKDVNRDLALNRLLGLPEVAALISSKHLRVRPLYFLSDQIKDEKLSFDLLGVTLRQALNQIAYDSGSKFWVLRRYPDGTVEIRIGCC